MIEVTNLTKRYGKKCAVDNISFTVNDGEILGFLGPNGAGKSTTMNILTGYLSSTAGTAVISGFDILENPLEAKRKIGYLPEQPPLYLEMTVREYLDFIFDLKKVKLAKAPHIEEICRLVKIDNVYHRVIRNLSKGYRQRVGLAQALVGNPEVLILDEPTVGLDPKQIIEIRNLIKQLGKSHTVILSSHILPEVQAVCDRVVVINDGRLVADDSPEHLSHNLSSDHRLVARIAGPEAEVHKLLEKIPGVLRVVDLGQHEAGSFDFSIEAGDDVDIRREMFSRLAARNWPMLSVKSSELSLEDVFLKLTDENASGAPAPEQSARQVRETVEEALKEEDVPVIPTEFGREEPRPSEDGEIQTDNEEEDE